MINTYLTTDVYNCKKQQKESSHRIMGPEVSTALSPQKKDSPNINSQQAIKLWYFNKIIIHKPNNLKERGLNPLITFTGSYLGLKI